MNEISLLGYPLELALEMLAQQGFQADAVRVERIFAPRRTEDAGELRVVRVRGNGTIILDVCAFVYTVPTP